MSKRAIIDNQCAWKHYTENTIGERNKKDKQRSTELCESQYKSG